MPDTSRVAESHQFGDPYSRITEVDSDFVTYLAQRLEHRAAEPGQRELRTNLLSGLELRDETRVLEVGCGTGAWSRDLAALDNVAEVVATDPSPQFIDLAKTATDPRLNCSYQVADGRHLPFPDESFDLVVMATVLCHVPEVDKAIGEAFRVLKPAGNLLIFDGDYVTTTVALSENDSLQRCVDAAVGRLVNDPWLVRTLLPRLKAAGFRCQSLRSHGYIETDGGAYMTSVIEFALMTLSSEGSISEVEAAELRSEARSRVANGTFFGHIAYASVIAQR